MPKAAAEGPTNLSLEGLPAGKSQPCYGGGSADQARGRCALFGEGMNNNRALLFPICDRSSNSRQVSRRDRTAIVNCGGSALCRKVGLQVNCGQCVWNSGIIPKQGDEGSRPYIRTPLPRYYTRWQTPWKTPTAYLLPLRTSGKAVLEHVRFCVEVGWIG